MTDFHYFEAPTDTAAGTLNPVFELLDFPIVMGGADDIVLTGPSPDKPMVDGREVTDPRLVKALSKPVEVDRAEVLDRSAKLGGILRAMGIIGTENERIVIAEDVPLIARALSILGAARIGASVDVRSGAASSASSADTASAQLSAHGSDDDITSVLVHTIDAPPINSGRASVKVIRSRFEGVGITVAGETANIDQAMRDSRVESAAVVPLAPDRALIVTDFGALDAESSLEWLSQEILPEA
ncbi:hypothetical protein SAMN04489751_3318 [Brevibacterium sandarakinum]|uniref:Uncharacterized protein n=1 Tax=Brevibacterium sandarakinum TaxID=629680 RepID=A0A1H1WCZ1_BRESA|nr:hypothetical protein [Brevibacterium sandarakinum]SDS94874.1 hypothetical protein SAMN04489751_3318 [Brevibacterium sandarakinum]